MCILGWCVCVRMVCVYWDGVCVLGWYVCSVVGWCV